MADPEPLDLVVVTANGCLRTSQQVAAMAAFLAAQTADVVFVQEANGHARGLLEALRGHDGFESAVLDPCTHILLRRGYFQPIAAAWPHRFYARARLPDADLLLLNVHLCEHRWSTDSDEEEWSYRAQFLQRQVAHLRQLPGGDALIVGGDLNAFSHQDRSLYLPATSAHAAMYERMYQRTVFSTLVLARAGLVDCWRACHPESRLALCVPFVSWPVAAAAIEHDDHLPREVDAREAAGRIDFLFVGAGVRVIDCQMMNSAKGWFSDHLAVVAHVRSSRSSSTCGPVAAVAAAAVPMIAVRLVFEAAGPAGHAWLLSASALSGEKNHYIEIERLVSGVASSRGWFYVDGLRDGVDCSIAAGREYMYGSFDPREHVDVLPHIRYQAVLYDDAQTELMRVDVQIEGGDVRDPPHTPPWHP